MYSTCNREKRKKKLHKIRKSNTLRYPNNITCISMICLFYPVLAEIFLQFNRLFNLRHKKKER